MLHVYPCFKTQQIQGFWCVQGVGWQKSTREDALFGKDRTPYNQYLDKKRHALCTQCGCKKLKNPAFLHWGVLSVGYMNKKCTSKVYKVHISD